MSNLAIAVAAMPGAPIGSRVMNFASALAPVWMALLALAVLGAIVLLVGRDAHQPAAPGCRRAEVADGEPRQQPADPKSLTPVDTLFAGGGG
jgi:hypothetical protein